MPGCSVLQPAALPSYATALVTEDDFGGYVEYTFTGGYVAHAGYRYVKYNEKQYNFDDNSAQIGELSVGYHW